MLLLIVCLLLGAFCAASAQNQQEWDASTFPNPTADGYVRCNMKSPASVCDPDAILNEAQRYRINYELNQLESRTRQLSGDNFCAKKGIVGAIAIARHVRGGSDNAVKVMANDMLRRWTLDKQCAKSLVIVLATEDKKFWVARDARVPVYAVEFTDLFNAQKSLFKEGNYQQALLNILEGTWNKALAKQGPAPGGDDTYKGTPFRPGPAPPPREGGGAGGLSPLSILGKIPIWIWLAIILIIIPVLCCCCCIYMCCCRGKGSENRQPQPADEDNNRPTGGGQRGGGGGRNMLSGILSGLGGGAAANVIGNFLRSKGTRGGDVGGGESGYVGGGGYPPGGGAGYQPGVQRGGAGARGLYPSVDVKDEGGGGNW